MPKGYPIDRCATDIDGKRNLSKCPTTAKIYLPGDQPLKAGELKNPDYAATPRQLVEAEAGQGQGRPAGTRTLCR
jgi:gamma-glutamyltranspeptidase